MAKYIYYIDENVDVTLLDKVDYKADVGDEEISLVGIFVGDVFFKWDLATNNGWVYEGADDDRTNLFPDHPIVRSQYIAD